MPKEIKELYESASWIFRELITLNEFEKKIKKLCQAQSKTEIKELKKEIEKLKETIKVIQSRQPGLIF